MDMDWNTSNQPVQSSATKQTAKILRYFIPTSERTSKILYLNPNTLGVKSNLNIHG